MSIDPNLPLEFEDGTPLHFTGELGERFLRVSIPAGASVYSNNANPFKRAVAFYYELSDGSFSGPEEYKKNYKTIRNVDTTDPLEGLFVDA